tara:strand:- start:1483 stop:2292 length:810 start_codon:yes stop_codon:yes gene_type:complete
MYILLFLLWLVTSLLTQGIICFIFAILYRLYPSRILHKGMWTLYNHWVAVLGFWVKRFIPDMELKVKGELPQDSCYILLSNHYSWLDILVLYTLAYNKLPGFVFVMKRSLVMIPILGVVCWGLGHPLLHRSRARKGGVLLDLLILQKASQRAKEYGYGMMIFPEGSRFTTKNAQNLGKFKNLLSPKTKGFEVILTELGGESVPVVDATIVYETSNYSLYDFFFKRVGRVSLCLESVLVKEMPASNWLKERWELKDHFISQQKYQSSAES